MKTFKLNDELEIVCEWKKTRIAFKHVATLLRNGAEVCETKICYQNRTWESFDFQSVAHKIVRQYFKGEVADAFIKRVDDIGLIRDDSLLKTCSFVAALGALECKETADQNKWKARFLKLCPGIDFPADFDKLSEEEKQRRLDAAIAVGLNKKGDDYNEKNSNLHTERENARAKNKSKPKILE